MLRQWLWKNWPGQGLTLRFYLGMRLLELQHQNYSDADVVVLCKEWDSEFESYQVVSSEVQSYRSVLCRLELEKSQLVTELLNRCGSWQLLQLSHLKRHFEKVMFIWNWVGSMYLEGAYWRRTDPNKKYLDKNTKWNMIVSNPGIGSFSYFIV